MKSHQVISYFSLILLINLASKGLARDDSQDLILTSSQKKALEKFKTEVIPLLEKDYMKSDIFLIRWLRARNFNTNTAKDMLMQSLQWRKENNMDSIHEEDWSFFKSDYPLYTDTYDVLGRPSMVANFGEWDIRRAVLAGKRDQLARWMIKGMDDVEIQVRDLQAQGKNITRWNFIFNEEKFSAQHICLQCLPIYTIFVAAYELNYPSGADKIILINTPQVFEVVLNLVRPIMSPSTREALKVYGTNKAEWEPIVFKEIERDQLPIDFGGTKIP